MKSCQTDDTHNVITAANTGVARNLLRGVQKGDLGTKVPKRGPEARWGSQKPETHAEYSTEHSHRSSQIAYCSVSDYTLKIFPATTGGHALMPPLGYATGGKVVFFQKAV